MLMYEWSTSIYILRISKLLIFYSVSKATLDIICETAFGYKADSLHNPHNELAESYEALVNLQTGAPTISSACVKWLKGTH